MPYVPRPASTATCAHCQKPFQSKHAGRKYCSNSCNVLASYARNGRPGGPRTTRAELEEMIARMATLLGVKSASVPTSKPVAKPQSAPKPMPTPAKKVVKKAVKKITNPAPPKPASKPKTAKTTTPTTKKVVASQSSAQEKANRERGERLIRREYEHDQRMLQRKIDGESV